MTAFVDGMKKLGTMYYEDWYEEERVGMLDRIEWVTARPVNVKPRASSFIAYPKSMYDEEIIWSRYKQASNSSNALDSNPAFDLDPESDQIVLDERMTLTQETQMHNREDKFQGEGETDPGSDPGTGPLRRAHPALRRQRHCTGGIGVAGRRHHAPRRSFVTRRRPLSQSVIVPPQSALVCVSIQRPVNQSVDITAVNTLDDRGTIVP
ncbi:hypothetical protein EVAR_77769_1 [Eumeta japonica]|uniref:Uncharacterized protein n=1 Tax=Eumeta variegata TaxID=151549 RepID=A0A4C1TAW1_EUMVA|nr:hypothetical protein EVAR_77769_1 [Eumeta japonica]